MNNDLTNIPQGHDPYAAYGAAAAAGMKIYLAFNKGEYQWGKDKEELPLGTRLAVNMPELQIGWQRWFEKKPAESRMQLLTSGTALAKRHELGHDDQALWERDKDGKLRDPWQLTNELPLALLDGSKEFVFSASSKSGISAVGALCKEYGREYRQRPGQLPVIELQRDSYMHAEHGKLYVPVFKLVDWVSAGGGQQQPPLPGTEQASKKTKF